MLELIAGYIYPRLAKRSFKNDDDLHVFLLLYVANMFSAAIHVCLIVMTLICRTWLLVGYNLVSLAIYAANFRLLRKNSFFAAGVVISVEVCTYTALCSLAIGVQSFTFLYLFLILIMQLITPYAPLRPRTLISAALLALMLACVFFMDYPPFIQLGSGPLRFFALFNTAITFIGISIEVFIGNVIQKTIEDFKQSFMDELQSQAYTDPLTGLYNRRYADMFFEKMGGGDEKPCCVAMLDIDDFKVINDRHGHAIGDEALKEISALLQRNLRKSDTVFRWGGEEFLIVLDGVDLETAGAVLEKVRKRIGLAEINSGTARFKLTVTIGVARLDTSDVEGSIENCDKRMYEGKIGTKNVVVK